MNEGKNTINARADMICLLSAAAQTKLLPGEKPEKIFHYRRLRGEMFCYAPTSVTADAGPCNSVAMLCGKLQFKAFCVCRASAGRRFLLRSGAKRDMIIKENQIQEE